LGSAVLTSAGARDVFAWKLDQNFNYIAATRMGGVGDDSTASVDGVSVGPDGTTYITGRFSLLATFEDVLLRSRGDSDGFVVALDGALNVDWAHRFGGGSNGEQDGSTDEGLGITADQYGHLYTTGRFRETADFANGDVATSVGLDDAFLWKFDVQTPRIRGTVFADLNGDGVNNDHGEGIVDGWTVYLDANDNGQLDAGETFTTTSGNSGYFDFGEQPAGTYTIRQQLPSGWTQSSPVNDAAHVLTLANDDGPVHVAFANHVATELTIHQSPDVPKRLRARGGAPVTSTLSIGESATVFDVNVRVDLTYDGTQGLEIFLNAPDGTRVELFSSAGGAGNDLAGTVFDDEATTFFRDAPAPFTGTFRPEYSLGMFDGMDSQGEWTLEINDRLGWTSGRLNSWSLEILSPLPLPPAPSFSIDDVDVTEGDSGAVTVTFNVTRSGDTSQQVSVDYGTVDDTAAAGSDYVAIPTATLTFAPGVTSLPISVTINGDADQEPDERFFVNLSNPVGGVISDGQGIGTILDDDSPIVANVMFVYDIRFDSKRGGKDHRAVFEIRADSDGDGQGTSSDNPVAGVEITVTFAGMTFTGTTDSSGVFRTPWIQNTPAGIHYANAVDLALADYVWDPLLDLEDDSDGDGKPDGVLTI
jgi:subtilisin-like proprotein convertase family protein